jgi:hypothetical protein
MSFALTTRQVRAREKTVTRRNGWRRARVGQVVQPIVKGQGLRKGEHVETIGGPIRFVDVRRERLDAITPEDVHREGFPGRSSKWFVAMYLEANGGRRDQIVTRIEFEYVGEPDRREFPGPVRWACRQCGNPRRRAECLSCGNTEAITDERRVPGLVS